MTGAGLTKEQMETTDFKNKMGKCSLIVLVRISKPFTEQIVNDFPWFMRLHGFWYRMPNYNPKTTSSEPGQQFGEEARRLLMPRIQGIRNFLIF